MTILGPELRGDVLEQCRIAAGEIGQSFTRAFGDAVEVTVVEPGEMGFDDLDRVITGPGLAVVLNVGSAAAAVVIPQKGALLPDWVSAPDEPAQQKLTALAQELGLLLLPEAYSPDEYYPVYVRNLHAALCAGKPSNAAVVELTLSRASEQSHAWLVWPLLSPERLAMPISAAGADSSAASGHHESGSVYDGLTPLSESERVGREDQFSELGVPRERPYGTPSGTAGFRRSLGELPPYARSLLKIRVPLSVTLAEKKQPVGQILEIGPGSILQFEKSCEDMLDLNVCNHPIARGEAVKVGDKFGLRVTSLILPGERFKPVGPAGGGTAKRVGE